MNVLVRMGETETLFPNMKAAVAAAEALGWSVVQEAASYEDGDVTAYGTLYGPEGTDGYPEWVAHLTVEKAPPVCAGWDCARGGECPACDGPCI